jgi:hypothetical protein
LLLTALSPKALPVFSFVLLRKIMFNRKMFVALVVCLAMSVSTALAGGGGAKKDSTIKVVNSGPNPIYAFVDVTDAKIQEAANSSDPIKAFNALGASGGNSANFSVKSGSHTVTAVDIVLEEPVGKQSVTTSKGKTSTVTF